MSSTYAGDPNNYPTDLTIPSDGDGPGIQAADVDPAFEGLADRTAFIHKFLAPGFVHPVRTGTRAQMQAVTGPVEGDVFLAIEAPAFAGAYRESAQLYYWDPQFNIAYVTGPDSPFVYQGVASVDYGPGLGLTGAWILVRPGNDIARRDSLFGTGGTTVSSGAGWTDLALTGPTNLALTILHVNQSDLLRVRCVLGNVNGDRVSGFRLVYTDGTDHVIPGSVVNYPNHGSEAGSVTMLGEYVIPSTYKNAAIRVQGIKDIGSGSGDITVAGECLLSYDVIRP